MRKIVLSLSVLATLSCAHKKENNVNGNALANLSFAEKELEMMNVGSSDNKFFDADNDGDMDLFVNGYTTEHKEFRTVAGLYINDGKGNYTESKENFFIGFEYGSVEIADIDKDGDNDIVSSGSFEGSLFLGLKPGYMTKVYRNEKGKFTEDTSQVLPADMGVIKLTDINNDKVPDLIYISEEAFNTYVNDGNGNFGLVANPNLKRVNSPEMVSFDVDNDSDNDLIVMGEVETADAFEPVVHIYLNDSGKFTAKENKLAGLSQGLLAYGDIDNDADLDLIISGIANVETVEMQDQSTYILKNDGEGNFESQKTEVPAYNLGQCLLNDFDNDGDLDLFLSGNRVLKGEEVNKDATELFLNNGNGNFELYKKPIFPGFNDFSMAFGDANTDGKIDVLVSYYDLDPKFKDAPIELDENGFEIEHKTAFTRLFMNTSK